MRLSIPTKIFIGFAFMVVIFTGVLMFGVYRTQSLFSQIERLNRRIVPVSLSLSDAQTDLKSFNLLLNERDPLVIRRTLQVAQLVHSLPDRIHQRIARAGEILASPGLEHFDAAQAKRLERLERRLNAIGRSHSAPGRVAVRRASPTLSPRPPEATSTMRPTSSG